MQSMLRLSFVLTALLAACCAAPRGERTVRLLQDAEWHTVYANHSGFDQRVLLRKDTEPECCRIEFAGGSVLDTQVRITRNDAAPSDATPSEPGAEFVQTGDLDLTLDEAQRLLVVPRGFRVVARTRQPHAVLHVSVDFRGERFAPADAVLPRE